MWHVLFCLFGFVEFQTDWMGGQAVLGPVTDWGTQYNSSDSVTAATGGQASLVATEHNYSAWVKHIVESDSGIQAHAQGLMPADIDDDGMQDLIAHSNNQVVWYKSVGDYNYIRCVIGPASDGGEDHPCVYPCDIDGDDDVDVLVATAGIGVGWFEQQNLTWTYHSLDDSTRYQRVSAADVELDGDVDIIAVDLIDSSFYHGDIYVFRNDGSTSFTRELAADLPDGEGGRVYAQDFNDDGYHDLYAVKDNTHIFLNDSTGHFTESFRADYWLDYDFDGAWPSDINMDGDVDLVCGIHLYNGDSVSGFSALLNDSMGENFTQQLLMGTETGGRDYGDGAMACDMDLDGMPDIVGTCRRVGYLRQDPGNPLTFSLYDIDSLEKGNSHWIYAWPLGRMCLPSIDLLVTDDGVHIVYENQMLLAFANLGWLESSVLEIARGCSLRYFGYKACVPYDTALAFYWRDGMNLLDVLGKPWSGPEYGSIGMTATDSFAVGPKSACMFQYKVEFRKGPDDIGVLYEIWLTYDCPSSGVEETCEELIGKSVARYVDGNLVLSLPYDQAVCLTVYNAAGRQVKDVFRGRLSKGNHTFAMPARSGIYFARIESHAKKESFKFTVLK
jgi:hypothetical protein